MWFVRVKPPPRAEPFANAGTGFSESLEKTWKGLAYDSRWWPAFGRAHHPDEADEAPVQVRRGESPCEDRPDRFAKENPIELEFWSAAPPERRNMDWVRQVGMREEFDRSLMIGWLQRL